MTHQETDFTEPEPRAQAIALLLGAAETTTEINTLTRIARRAGFLWRCTKCRQDCYPTSEACSSCAPPVPDDAP